MSKNVKKVTSVINGKVDFFSANRSMSLHVADFMFKFVKAKEINAIYNKKIDELNRHIDSIENLEGSIFSSEIPELKAKAFDQVTLWEKERSKMMEEQASYSLTDNDKAFKKGLSNCSEDQIKDRVIDWFAFYGLNVEGTMLLEEVCSSFGMKLDIKTLVLSNGKACMKRDSAQLLKNLYGICYQHMISVGTIKVTQIPQVLRDKYAPKPKAKKSAK